MRYFAEIKYDGTHYHGWQIQPNAVSVQETVANELSKLIIGKEALEIVGCGRTDTGVHASQYYFHFETEMSLDANLIAFKLNHMLPDDISVVRIFEVADDLHARFSAVARTYHYFINFNKDPFDRFHAYYFTKELDLQVMNKACEMLKKHQDFTSFSKVNTDVKTFNCDIFDAEWRVEGSGIVFVISANRFLRNMVRAIVGTMIEVGTHKISLDEFNEVILAKDRSKAGKSVPGHGLFLSKVEYKF